MKEYGTIFKDAKLKDYLRIDNDISIAEYPNYTDILECMKKIMR